MEEKKPVTKKALETRQKLLTATIDQIALKGYHNITVDEIAAACGLSTGTAYRYFANKTEMLVQAIRYYYENIAGLSDTGEDRLRQFAGPEEAMAYVLDRFYELHEKYYGIHEELESLRHIDPEVKEAYDGILLDAMEKILDRCPAGLKELPDRKERLFLALSLLEDLSHLQIDAKSKAFDMEAMKKITIKSVMQILKL